YSAGSFPHPSSPAPGSAFFAPGNQGDATMTQTANVASAAAAIDTGTVTATLSGWLGGWTSYGGYVQVSDTFVNASGAAVGSVASLPTVTAADRGNQTGFLARSTTVTVPAGTRAIRTQVQFLDSSGESGYLDNLSLTLSTPVTTSVLAPPPSVVPRYDHVFMVMMENTDYSAVVADTTGMPFFHSLMAKGTTMADYHAVYHPSDENYLAVAGGDTYARGAVYWPNITDPDKNLGDELEANGLSWKAYEQGMGVPCNDSSGTEHTYDSYYEPDDAPFINYTDVSGNATRCKAHLVDTSQLGTDLKQTSTTPAFSWLAADDYYDGESAGDGNAASRAVQDGWLKQTIAPIMSSPAWTSQRSLLIVTWDEDESEADNQVAAVAVDSAGLVPAGHTSNTRYDHYSTGRTIENALGLAPFTANDKYATPFNDAFTGQDSDLSAATSGTNVTVRYQTPAADAGATNWIGIYHAGDLPGSQGSITWQYAPDTAGTLTFATSSVGGAGSYSAFFCADNGYSILAGAVPITVT
ncbi:MAG TPA: alkaline phosphatase family protein, partial [Pseudonocardiaceae bacterium]|nr:alkaline phosphatase family protein [Pseudonocardiaceae bacterium]